MELALYGIPVVLLIIGLLQFAKSQGLPTERAPVVALLLGVTFTLVGMLTGALDIEPFQAVVLGLVAGLSAAGMYDNAKAAIGK